MTHFHTITDLRRLEDSTNYDESYCKVGHKDDRITNIAGAERHPARFKSRRRWDASNRQRK